jgi:hypothetical protein
MTVTGGFEGIMIRGVLRDVEQFLTRFGRADQSF